MSTPGKIKVLVVDDSGMVRKLIIRSLAADPAIEVVGEAGDPYEARDKMMALNPDVVTLDIEMPKMDGLTFLRVIQKHRPTPVIIISSLTKAGSQVAVDALEAGAFEVLGKPTDSNSFGNLGADLAFRVKGAALAPKRAALLASGVNPRPAAVLTGANFHPQQLILVGSSTGGIEALSALLPHLPGDLPPICVTQHIPAYVSKAVAQRLNERCSFEVREAADGDVLKRGLALIAPGDFHMNLDWQGGQYRVRLTQTPKVNFCRPSVDVMFHSASQAGAHCVAVMLTGMGNDGAAGMKLLHSRGARTFAQNEATCVVYGMPAAAVEAGAVDEILPIQSMAAAVTGAAVSMARQAERRLKPGVISADVVKAT